VIATTNKLDDIDKGLRRGGRLDLDIRMDMPSAEDRLKVLQVHLSGDVIPHTIDEEGLFNLANAASGFVSSDLAQIVRNARLIALKETPELDDCKLEKKHLEQAMILAKPLSI
jgi:transitional endoplasmic reticulum ATPase